MSVLQYLKEALLNEITADDKFNQFYDGKIDRDIFDLALNLDPTSNGDSKVGNYVDWLLKNKDSLDVIDPDKFSKMLSIFDKQKTKLDPDNRDINKMDIPKFISIMNDAEKNGVLLSKKDKERARKKLAEENSEVVYNDDTHIVVVPKTMQASQYYAAGCAWCTGHQNDDACYFNNDLYVNGDIYIIYDKKTRQKWQMFWEQGKDTGEYKDCKNMEFEPREEFEGTALLNWINEKGFPEDHGDTYDDNEEDNFIAYEEAIHELENHIELPVALQTNEFHTFLNDETDYSADNISIVTNHIGDIEFNPIPLIEAFTFAKNVGISDWEVIFPAFFSDQIEDLEYLFSQSQKVYGSDIIEQDIIPSMVYDIDYHQLESIIDEGYTLEDTIELLLRGDDIEINSFFDGSSDYADLYMALLNYINHSADITPDDVAYLASKFKDTDWVDVYNTAIDNDFTGDNTLDGVYIAARLSGMAHDDLYKHLESGISEEEFNRFKKYEQQLKATYEEWLEDIL